MLPFQDGDVGPGDPRRQRADGDIDLLIGIGGAPEGVLTAAAVRGLGGHMEARLAPQHPEEIARELRGGRCRPSASCGLDELVGGDGYLFLTAVTAAAPRDGLAGVSASGEGIDPYGLLGRRPASGRAEGDAAASAFLTRPAARVLASSAV